MAERSGHVEATHQGGLARNPWMILFAVSLGLFMSVADISILNIALPSIADEMNASIDTIQWTVIAYTLTLTALVPLFGRISDIFGRKRLFMAGVFILSLGSLMAGLSGSVGMLVFSRVVQAVGGALISTNTLAIVTDTFPPGKRGLAMGIQGIIISSGAATGPTLGGFLVTHFSWEAVFYINLPVGVLTMVLAAKYLPDLRSGRTLEPVDWTGGALFVTALAGALLVFTEGPAWGWLSPGILALTAFSAAAFVAFYFWERRVPYPLIDLSLFRDRSFTAGQLTGLLATVCMSALTFMLPFYWQVIRGLSAQDAGMVMLPLPLTIMCIGPLAGWLSDRFGADNVASTGLGVLTVGALFATQITADMNITPVVLRIIVIGVGLGLFMAPNNNAVMSTVPPHRRGIASGLLGTFRFTGQSLGVALTALIFALTTGTSRLDIHANMDPELLTVMSERFMTGMHAVTVVMVPIAALTLIVSLSRRRPRVQSDTPAFQKASVDDYEVE